MRRHRPRLHSLIQQLWLWVLVLSTLVHTRDFCASYRCMHATSFSGRCGGSPIVARAYITGRVRLSGFLVTKPKKVHKVLQSTNRYPMATRQVRHSPLSRIYGPPSDSLRWLLPVWGSSQRELALRHCTHQQGLEDSAAMSNGRTGVHHMEDDSLDSARSSGQSPIIGHEGLSLDQVAKLDDSVLVESLNRFLGDVNEPDAVVFAGFNASL